MKFLEWLRGMKPGKDAFVLPEFKARVCIGNRAQDVYPELEARPSDIRHDYDGYPRRTSHELWVNLKTWSLTCSKHPDSYVHHIQVCVKGQGSEFFEVTDLNNLPKPYVETIIWSLNELAIGHTQQTEAEKERQNRVSAKGRSLATEHLNKLKAQGGAASY